MSLRLFGNGLAACLSSLALLLASPAFAETPPAGAAATSQASELEAASEAASAAQQHGPAQISLGDQGALDLPAGFSFIPKVEAARLMHAMGNLTDGDFLGLVIGEQMNGFVSVRFERAGYVKDDDAKDWDADELLQNLKDGTEQANEQRAARGIAEFVVAGWVEKPAYDASTHRLVWSAEVRDKHPAEDSGAGVNYNTYQLGREGYYSMNLVTDLASVEAEKPIARQLLAGLSFNEGKRYGDFDSSVDKVAEYGLAALVGGAAAKKLGLLAVMGAFLAKFAKVIALAALGVGAAVKGWLGRKNKSV